MELELRSARLIEDVMLPEGVVTPGTSVRYAELPSGEERRVVLLGPWDVDPDGKDDVISYRSPLALGILGRRPGDQAHVVLPGGELDVRILDVAPARLPSE
jgi:transcription elongation factor GreA